MSSKEIEIEYQSKKIAHTIPLDWNLFLKEIKSLFKFTNLQMNHLVITYKDPEEDNNFSFLVLECQEELNEFISISHESFISLNFDSDYYKLKEKEEVKDPLPQLSIIPKTESQIIDTTSKESKEDNKVLLLELKQMMITLMSETKKDVQQINTSISLLNEENKLIKKKIAEVEDSIIMSTQSILSNQIKEKKQIEEKLQEKVTELDKSFSQMLSGMNNERIVRKKSHILHAEINCNNCNMKPIRGIRYQCSHCEGISLCEKCFDQSIHNEHTFLLIKDSEKYKEQSQIQLSNHKKSQLDQDKSRYSSFDTISSKVVTQFTVDCKKKTSKVVPFSSSKEGNFTLSSTKLKVDPNYSPVINNDVDDSSSVKEKDNNIQISSNTIQKKMMNDNNIKQDQSQQKGKEQFQQDISNDKSKQTLMKNTLTPSGNTKDKPKIEEPKQKNEVNVELGKGRLNNTNKDQRQVQGQIENKKQQSSLPKNEEPAPKKEVKTNWDKEYHEMDKKYSISDFETKDAVIKMLMKHNGDIEAAFNELLANSN